MKQVSIAQLKSWLDATLAFFYPEACQICARARATPEAGYVCGGCYQQLRFIKPPFCERCGLPFEGDITASFECSNCREMELHFVSARSAVVAKGAALEIIHRYKYRRALWFEPLLADLLVRQAQPMIDRRVWDWIVPVPLHPLKQREREFNQAERLAVRLAAATRMPVKLNCLRRVLPTRTQTLLNRTERTDNVRRAFATPDGLKLDGPRIVLVDDVFTTGATTSACARALKKAGASEVCVWTVARGL